MNLPTASHPNLYPLRDRHVSDRNTQLPFTLKIITRVAVSFATRNIRARERERNPILEN